MLPAILGAIGTGASLWSGDRDRKSAERATERTNQANLEESARNRAFQSEQSSTAYQRSVLDMKRAGLNPAVMLQGAGQAASSGSGSMAVMQSGADQILSSGLERARTIKEGVGNAMGRMRDVAELKIAAASKKLLDAQTFSAMQHTDNQYKEGRLLDIDLLLRTAEAPTQLRKFAAEGSIPGLGYVDAFADRAGRVLGPVSNLGAGMLIRGGLRKADAGFKDDTRGRRSREAFPGAR